MVIRGLCTQHLHLTHEHHPSFLVKARQGKVGAPTQYLLKVVVKYELSFKNKPPKSLRSSGFSSPEPKAGLDPSCETILDIRPSLHGSCPTSPVFNAMNNFKLRSSLFEDVCVVFDTLVRSMLNLHPLRKVLSTWKVLISCKESYYLLSVNQNIL